LGCRLYRFALSLDRPGHRQPNQGKADWAGLRLSQNPLGGQSEKNHRALLQLKAGEKQAKKEPCNLQNLFRW
jgi:hypothetical protein